MIISTAPAYSLRCFSSHWTLSASRWLVGSSSSRIEGFWISSRVSAMRRFSPPERFSTDQSDGGQRSASIATSSWLSSVQPSTASILP